MRRSRPLCEFVFPPRAGVSRAWLAIGILAIAFAGLLLQACGAGGNQSVPVRTGGPSESDRALTQCNARLAAQSADAGEGGAAIRGQEVALNGYLDNGHICFSGTPPTGGAPGFRTRFVVTADVAAYQASQAGSGGYGNDLPRPQNATTPTPLARPIGIPVARPAPSARPGVDVRARVEVQGLSAEETRELAASIQSACGGRIQGLFRGQFRPAVPLTLRLSAAASLRDAIVAEGAAPTTAESARSRQQPKLELHRTAEGHFTFAQIASTAQYDPTPPPATTCASAANGESCERDYLFEQNRAFCRDLAKMTGHWLGLSDPECPRDPAAPEGRPASAGVSERNFMRSRPATPSTQTSARPSEGSAQATADAGPEHPADRNVDRREPFTQMVAGDERTAEQKAADAQKAAEAALWTQAQMMPEDFAAIYGQACPDIRAAAARDRTRRERSPLRR